MKKIKIIKTILLIVLFSSCSTEEKTTCTECVEVLEYSTDADPTWIYANQKFPTDYNCLSNGYTYIVSGYQSATGNYVYRRRRVECK